MKRLKAISLYLGFMGLGLAFIIGTLVLVSNLAKNENTADKYSCSEKGISHTAHISNDTITPNAIEAKPCDTLTIVNNDKRTRLIAFGRHDGHLAYSGVSEQLLKTNNSFTVTLNRLGLFEFHDHLQEEVKGEFTVYQ